MSQAAEAHHYDPSDPFFRLEVARVARARLLDVAEKVHAQAAGMGEPARRVAAQIVDQAVGEAERLLDQAVMAVVEHERHLGVEPVRWDDLKVELGL
jgi:hypothetical protein